MIIFKLFYNTIFLLTFSLLLNGAYGLDKFEKTPENTKIKSLLLNNTSVGDFSRLISGVAGLTVVATEKAAGKKISVFIENQSSEAILKAVCRANKLWFKKDTGSAIIYIQTLEEYKKSLKIYSDETVEAVEVLYPAVEDIGELVKDLFQDKVVWTLPNKDTGDESFRIDRALERMDKLAGRGQFALNKSDDSNDDDSNSDNEDENNDGARSYNTNRLLHALREKRGGKESIIDELIYTAGEKIKRESATGKPGTVYVAAMPVNNTLLLRSSDPNALTQVKKVIKELDKPSPQVLLEVKILELNIDDEHRRGIDWLFSQSNNDTTYGGGFADGIPDIDGQGGGQQILPANSELIPQGSGMDSRAAVFSYVSRHVRARIQMMELEGKIRSLATPTLLVTDGEASRIFIGSESTILTSVEVTSNTTSGDNPVTTRDYNPETERRNIGTSLLITPRIHADRTVTIRIMQENSSPGDTRKIIYGIDDNGRQLYFDTTDIDQRTITTTIIAKNTETLAIGGLITEEDEDSTQGLPWVADIPVIGKAFERVTRVKNRKELLVLLRPFVLLAPGEGESVSMDFIEKISAHPSAKKDLPELGIGRGDPFEISKDDPWYKKLYGKMKVWNTVIDWGEKYDKNEAVKYEK